MVAGGSSMPVVLEDFFEMIRTPVIVGYGMTVSLFTPLESTRVESSRVDRALEELANA